MSNVKGSENSYYRNPGSTQTSFFLRTLLDALLLIVSGLCMLLFQSRGAFAADPSVVILALTLLLIASFRIIVNIRNAVRQGCSGDVHRITDFLVGLALGIFLMVLWTQLTVFWYVLLCVHIIAIVLPLFIRRSYVTAGVLFSLLIPFIAFGLLFGACLFISSGPPL